MSLKRPRTEFDDSDNDEPSLGRQILPVANLPSSFDGEPVDGLQYLFTVRRDAKKLPHVTRVANPFEQSQRPLPPSLSFDESSSHPSLPSSEWRGILRERFNNLRKNVIQPTAQVQQPQIPARRLMPDKRERDLWWIFLSGHPESEWNAPKKAKQRKIKPGMRAFREESTEMPYTDADAYSVTSVDKEQPLKLENGEEGVPELVLAEVELVKPVPRPLTPILLQHIDQRMSLHLLMYFAYWINLHLDDPPFPRLADVHAQWIFFLLTRVDDHISADDMSLLRSLVRACLGLVKVMLRESEGEPGMISKESCWVIITTVIGVWGQQDLWADAETMLKSVES